MSEIPDLGPPLEMADRSAKAERPLTLLGMGIGMLARSNEVVG